MTRIDRDQLVTGQIIHTQIAHTAKGICEAVWEECSYDDKFHRRWPKVKPFVQRFWADFIPYARDSLAQLLRPIPGTECDPNGPKYANTEYVREQIYEALLIDGAYKAPPRKTLDQIRAEAGFEPLSEVLKSKYGKIIH